jgi:hypothetical protein
MGDFDYKPGTLLPGGIVCDHALPMTGGDCEYRIAPRFAPVRVAPRVVAADEAPGVDMATFFPHWNRLRRL